MPGACGFPEGHSGVTNKSLINIDGDFSTRPPALEKGDLYQLLPFKRSIVGSVFLGALQADYRCASDDYIRRFSDHDIREHRN